MDRFESLCQKLEQLEKVDGITPADVLQLPDPLDELMQEIIRRGSIPLDDLATWIELPVDQAHEVGDELVEKGYLRSEEQQADGGVVYHIYFARMRRRAIPDIF